ncbi:DUF6668 family protein [Microbacterium sp. NPDC007973]|uniref:DUF6668 family protein n=1 Tax=Microbacterium sp. NPDC007973 TaxID=3364182 RepID=UPI0036E244F8
MSDPQNPWLSRPTTPPSDSDVPIAVVPSTFGPVAPQRGVPAPDQVDQLPIADQRATPAVWWLGAHGGAGESTLATLAPGWSAAAGHAWPRSANGEPTPVVIVARSNAAGLRAAQNALRQWAAKLTPSNVLGLVVMADAPGRMPRALRDLLAVVGGGGPRTWTVPWVDAWRLDDPTASPIPREVQRVIDELSALPGIGAAGTTN